MIVVDSGIQSNAAELQTAIARLLRPNSIAIVGASDKRGSLGASVLSNLDAADYTGAMYLINPNRIEIAGRACLCTVDDLPDGVDCVVIAIPKAGVLDTLRACARRGVGSAIIFSAGYAESGEDGKVEQAEIRRIAKQSGMAVLGPNCLGTVNALAGLALTFIATRPERTRARGVGVVSQSGAMAAVLGGAFRTHELDLSYSISTGNEAVTGVEDYVEFLLNDLQTAVIAVLAEQIRQPSRFIHLAGRARSLGKPIILLHPGSSAAARASAATHTGALAGDYEVMRVKVIDAGVVFVETLEELIDTTHILMTCDNAPSAQAGACVLTESGAFKALMLDLCEKVGLPLPHLSPTAEASLREALPAFIPPSNPLDLTAQALVDPDLYRRTLPPLLADDVFGWLILTIILTDQGTMELKLPPILSALSSMHRTKPILFAGVDEGVTMPAPYRRALGDLHVPFFPTAERALRAVARVRSASVAERSASIVVASGTSPRLPAGSLSEFESKQVLRDLGSFASAIPRGSLATSCAQAIEIAESLKIPVAIKAQSRHLMHKTEAGGVLLNLRSASEIATAWSTLHTNVERFSPGLVLDGVLVEEMCARGTEFIVGCRNDPDWGPVVLVGLGGVFAEALQDVRLLVPGLTPEQIEVEIGKLKATALLKGFRGAPPPDLPSLARIVAWVGEFASAHPEVREIDLNPVLVHASGATILDALIVSS